MSENAFLISQILVGIAFITDFLSFQFKDRKKILLLLCISVILISSHYFLLGKVTASVLTTISLLRFSIAYFSTKKIWMFLLLSLTLLSFIFTYTKPISFIVLLGAILMTVGAFQEKDQNLRRIMMIGATLIIIYDSLIFSPMAILLGITFLISNLIGYYRFYVRKNSLEKEFNEWDTLSDEALNEFKNEKQQ
jgi:hypothetical protein